MQALVARITYALVEFAAFFYIEMEADSHSPETGSTNHRNT